MIRYRSLARVATPIAALAGVVLLGGPAFAHTGVTSQQAQALAVDAVLSFKAAGESDTAGIDEVQVVLPAGIAPADVSLVKAPEGWTFKPGAEGFSLAGPGLAPGKNAEYQVKVRQLPDAQQVVFKTLVLYTDTQVDRWIEVPQGGSEPKNPAPVLKLAKAAPGATPLAAASPSPSPSPSPTPSPSPSQAVPSARANVTLVLETSTEKSLGNGGIVIGTVAVLLVAVGGVIWWRRRSARS
ncbi:MULTISPECIES: DUF1775 domain-containing protein [unclassified Kitasatospora]|uniref:DUF1775 domain-containing protein n=1 Tax=unclassified Kitasatospora TaxID=2633591 RepID=UPI0007091227|nr:MULTISPECIES: DUF1775 domain-containing protein [unclassified Kitasatospora]KQV15697.1 hypothetical protein ASC99_29550 [Kitasatospora sp. Root107]KRB71684.1 hypothetical protein ASE03_24100 [Kitasatospora sp. Root187]